MGLKLLEELLEYPAFVFFVDDSFIFCKACSEEIREIKDILEDYCNMSEQMINFNKSAICFSKGTIANICNRLARMLGVRMVVKNEKYRGNPLIVGRSKT